MTDQAWPRCAAWTGTVLAVDYLVSHFVPLPPLPERVVFFAVGVLFVTFSVALGRTMRETRRAVAIDLAAVLGVVGGACFTMMAVVQSAIHPVLRRPLDPALDAATVGTVRTIWHAVDLVQLGMDVTWDLFGLSALALFGWSMRRDPRFGAALGIAGAAVCVASIALNLWFFPAPPTPDLGPVVGLWGAAVAGALWRAIARARRVDEGTASPGAAGA